LERRRDRLRNLWRILVLSGAATGLGWLLLREGWVLRSPAQIELVGSRQVSREQVIREAQLLFPQPLLYLRPQQLAQRLSAGLPVEDVLVSRLMLPPRLRIQLADRQPVARAERRIGSRLEQGFVDRLGNWMTSRQQRDSGTIPAVTVVGWQERLRPALAMILARSQQLGSPLTQVRFEPNGSVWLHTVALGRVHLGPPDARLPRRLEVLQHLSGQLPRQIRGLSVQSIDLSDPNRPELGLPAPRRGASAPTRPASMRD
jgi:cell division protein FtsQ